MTVKKNYKGDAFASIHETASGYYEAGAIDQQTMRHFDEFCLKPIREVRGDEQSRIVPLSDVSRQKKGTSGDYLKP